MTSFLPNDKENIVAALSSKHINHICIIRLDVTGSQLESIAKVMQEPLPVLKCLQINLDDVNAPELPAKFLGGSAPNLWEVSLYNILYLSLPAFLLSAIDLIKLNLHKVPPNGYISPKAVVVGLAALLKLEIFILGFLCHPHQIPLPSATPSYLQDRPSLTYFEFNSTSKYLEDLVPLN